MSAGNELDLHSAGAVNNAGSAYAGRDLRLQAASVTTAGSLSAARDAQLSVEGQLLNSGTIVAGNALSADAAQLESSGDIGSQRGDATLRSRGNLGLSGNTVAGGALALDAASGAQVSGTVNAASVDLRSGGDASLSGALHSTRGALTVAAAGELANDAVVRSAGALDLQADGVVRQRGQLHSDGGLQLRGGSVAHHGLIDTGGDLRIASVGALALDGTVQSAGSTT